MEKLKYIKIEHQDGTLSENVPIGVDANNVDVGNENLSTKLNTIINNTTLAQNAANNANEKANINTNNINVLTSRVDNIANLEEGSTTGDAELIDGRIGYLGETYSSIGNAIRKQTGLNKENSTIKAFPLFSNIEMSWSSVHRRENLARLTTDIELDKKICEIKLLNGLKGWLLVTDRDWTPIGMMGENNTIIYETDPDHSIRYFTHLNLKEWYKVYPNYNLFLSVRNEAGTNITYENEKDNIICYLENKYNEDLEDFKNVEKSNYLLKYSQGDVDIENYNDFASFGIATDYIYSLEHLTSFTDNIIIKYLKIYGYEEGNISIYTINSNKTLATFNQELRIKKGFHIYSIAPISLNEGETLGFYSMARALGIINNAVNFNTASYKKFNYSNGSYAENSTTKTSILAVELFLNEKHSISSVKNTIEENKNNINSINNIIRDIENKNLSSNNIIFKYNFFNNLFDEEEDFSNLNLENITSNGYNLDIGFNNRVTINKMINSDNYKLIYKIQLLDSNSVIALSSTTTLSSRSSLVSFNFSNNTINFHTPPTSSYTNVLVSKNITNTNGTEFLLEVGRKNRNIYAKITNIVTNETIDFIPNETNLKGQTYGWFYDYPQFSLISGECLIKSITCLMPSKPLFLFMGDSITQGYGVEYNNAWAKICCDYYQNNSYISSRSGGTYQHILDKLDVELEYIHPKYVVVTIGTNGGSNLTNMTQIKEKIEQAGSIPIINCIYQKVGSSGSMTPSSIAELNNIILGMGVLSARLDIATSINNDITRGADSSLYQQDGLHLNDLGNQKVAERFIKDMSLLLQY